MNRCWLSTASNVDASLIQTFIYGWLTPSNLKAVEDSLGHGYIILSPLFAKHKWPSLGSLMRLKNFPQQAERLFQALGSERIPNFSSSWGLLYIC